MPHHCDTEKRLIFQLWQSTCKNPPPSTAPSPVRAPHTLEISELFQIDKGKIDQVEAVLDSVPYGMRSAVWDVP